MPDLKQTTAFQYVNKTQHKRSEIQHPKKHEIAPEPLYKTYPSAHKIKLPYNWQLSEARIVPLFQNRRSLRKYASEKLNLEEVSFLLWSSQGVTAKGGDMLFRTIPSAGALYPIETYLSIHNVKGLDTGLYHFDVQNFALNLLEKSYVGDRLSQACLAQSFVEKSAITFIWTGNYRRTMSKYGDRGFRYILFEAGHICQNLLIAAEALACGGCPIAAFFDDEVNTILNINEDDETALYVASVGKKITTT
ncbi:MAG: SagB/ThcOx family dehydrogenase [Bacteroidetes bacterium]|nr:SagB/ThcOx family dehydrogenase [Bacteroidota bacterium]